MEREEGTAKSGASGPPADRRAPPPEADRGRGGAGPGWMVAAAFIGPGTVTTATVAGAEAGVALLWALAFSLLATLVLQEMSARLGVVTGLGLGEAVRRRFGNALLRVGAVVLILGAVALGNAAFEAGNLLGAALGLQGALGGGERAWAALVGVAAFGLLWTGSYRVVERALMGLVALMSVVFVATAVTVAPAIAWDAGALIPSLDDAGLLLAVALIGTTVVPYNLFLHASAVRERWSGPEGLGAARRNLVLSVGVGGAVSAAILLTAAGTIHPTGARVEDAGDMAVQLEPLLGSWARIFFAVGLFGAGMTSAVTAPLAAAYATAGALGWEKDLRGTRFRAVWAAVLLAGLATSVTGLEPVRAIVFAQAANGILLPFIAFFLLLAVNDGRWMGRWRNGGVANAVGTLVVLVAAGLGLRGILQALGVL